MSWNFEEVNPTQTKLWAIMERKGPLSSWSKFKNWISNKFKSKEKDSYWDILKKGIEDSYKNSR